MIKIYYKNHVFIIFNYILSLYNGKILLLVKYYKFRISIYKNNFKNK